LNKKEFGRIRSNLGKTQAQMAHLLGCSVKTVQSFEQGLRKIPVHVERQLLFLLSCARSQGQENKGLCWEINHCPIEMRRKCPAWEFQLGHLCWFVNGTFCKGEVQVTWREKIRLCRKCEVFHQALPGIYDREPG